MTNKEAIKFLQQLYPNGGHCWLDEQRIEAIDIAVKALQEEPISDDLNTAAKVYADNITDKVGYKLQLRRAVVYGANWHKEQMMAKAFEGEILEIEDNDCAMCSHTHLELFVEPNTLEKKGFKDKDKVKVIVIKEC